MKNIDNRTTSVLLTFLVGFLTIAMIDPLSFSKINCEDNDEVMKRMDSYIGKWKSDTKTNQQNSFKFYFTYDLSYFNPDKTILKMIISQHFDDGKESLLWEGYKGWNPAKKEAYYHGFSPSGRFATGVVFVKKEKLITEYTGYDIDGNPVKIRDEFFPAENEKFKSVTNLKPQGGEWRVVGTDEWTRI